MGPNVLDFLMAGNLAFVANLFNNHPSQDKPDIDWEGLENLEET